MKKLFMFILILISITSYSMQPPKPMVALEEPFSIAQATKLEPKKFNKYKLNKTENAFLPSLREAFQKDKNLVNYLENLQILASGLLLQHMIMERVQEMSDLNQQAVVLEEANSPLLKKITKQKTDFSHLAPDNDFQLNELITNYDTVKTREPNAQQLKQIFIWILDTSKGEWINALGKYLKTRYEIDLHEAELYTTFLTALYTTLAAAAPFTYAHAPKNQFLSTNINYLISVIFHNTKFQTAYSKVQTKAHEDEANKELMNHFEKLSKLYHVHQQSYLQMYALVRKELYDTFSELMKAGQKNITPYLLPLPEISRKAGKIPNKFPETLTPLPEITRINVPSLVAFNEQWLTAQKEWELSQAQAPAKKKYVKRRKKMFPITTEAAPTKETKEPEEAAPAKIRTASDDSYIAEGAEDDIQIIIEDPKNDLTATLFKTKMNPANAARLKNLPRKDYTPNVQQWFDSPKKARVDQGHTDLNSPKYRAGEPEWKPIALHAFSRLVDDYLYSYGTVGEINSRSQKGKNDILVTAPGKLEYPDGTQETGVFAYIIDSATGQWYHRMFTPHSSKNLVSDLFEKGYFAPDMTGYYDVFFPPLAPRKK